MNTDKAKNNNKEEDNMTNNISFTKDNFSLSDFIKLNKLKIKAITPHNPSIKKDDEWRNENYWDELYKEQSKK